MQKFKEIIGDLPFNKKIVLLITLVLALAATFLTFGDSTELRNLVQLVLQLGQIIVDDLGSREPGPISSDLTSLF